MNDTDLAYYTARVRREALEEASALILSMHTTSLRAISDRVLDLAQTQNGDPK